MIKREGGRADSKGSRDSVTTMLCDLANMMGVGWMLKVKHTSKREREREIHSSVSNGPPLPHIFLLI